jgi:hypothetical protein
MTSPAPAPRPPSVSEPLPCLPKAPYAFLKTLKSVPPSVAPTRAAGRATNGPQVRPWRFPLFTRSYRGSPLYVALMPRCPKQRVRGAAPHQLVTYLRVAPFSLRATGHPSAPSPPPPPSRPSTHSKSRTTTQAPSPAPTQHPWLTCCPSQAAPSLEHKLLRPPPPSATKLHCRQRLCPESTPKSSVGDQRGTICLFPADPTTGARQNHAVRAGQPL